MKTVIKIDGRKEDFIKEKIIVSCLKCGATIEAAREIADKLEKNIKFPVKTTEIRDLVLKELAKKDKDWANNWYLYDKAVKKRIITY